MTPHTILRAAQARALRQARQNVGMDYARTVQHHFAKVRWQLEMRLRAEAYRRESDKINKQLLEKWNASIEN